MSRKNFLEGIDKGPSKYDIKRQGSNEETRKVLDKERKVSKLNNEKVKKAIDDIIKEAEKTEKAENEESLEKAEYELGIVDE